MNEKQIKEKNYAIGGNVNGGDSSVSSLVAQFESSAQSSSPQTG